MKTIRNHYKTILLLSVLIAMFYFASLSTRPAYAQQRQRATQSSWLNQFEGKMVKLHFIVPPPGKKGTEEVRLVTVESNGVIVKYKGPNAIFYTFSNLIAINPY